jgi:hypothetical protein
VGLWRCLSRIVDQRSCPILSAQSRDALIRIIQEDSHGDVLRMIPHDQVSKIPLEEKRGAISLYGY